MAKKRMIKIKQLKSKLPMYMEHFYNRLTARYSNSYWDNPGEMMKAITQFIEKYKLEYMVNIRYHVGVTEVTVLNLTGRQSLIAISIENAI